MTALEKFLKVFNKISTYWEKSVKITVSDGQVILIECDGFAFKTDKKEMQKSS